MILKKVNNAMIMVSSQNEILEPQFIHGNWFLKNIHFVLAQIE